MTNEDNKKKVWIEEYNDGGFFMGPVSVHRKNKLGQAPLIIGAIRANLALVEECLAKGADPNIKDVDGKNALSYAIYGLTTIFEDICFKIVCLLIDITDPTANFIDGQITHFLAYYGKLDVLKIALNTGKYDIKAKNINGETLLHRACASKMIEVIKFLVENGLSLEDKNICGMSPKMFYESRYGKFKLE